MEIKAMNLAPPTWSTAQPQVRDPKDTRVSGASAAPGIYGKTLPAPDPQAEAPEHGQQLSLFSRTVCAGLIGAMGVLALTGCGKTVPTPPTSSTSATQPSAASKAAEKQLAGAFDEAEKAIQESKGGDAQKSAEAVTRKLMSQIQEYAKKTGRSAEQVASDVKGYVISHPGVSAAVIVGGGVATGIVLEKAGVPEKIAAVAGNVVDGAASGTSSGLSAVADAVKTHPVLSGAIAAGLAAGTGYLIYTHVAAPAK